MAIGKKSVRHHLEDIDLAQSEVKINETYTCNCTWTYSSYGWQAGIAMFQLRLVTIYPLNLGKYRFIL
jgi:hypothetical protein